MVQVDGEIRANSPGEENLVGVIGFPLTAVGRRELIKDFFVFGSQVEVGVSVWDFASPTNGDEFQRPKRKFVDYP